jgi:hypothetical protein
MATSTTTKTNILLLTGAAAIALILLPIRLAPTVAQSIDTLSIQTREQLIQLYEKPARQLLARTDTLRRDVIRRQGGTRPSQDSLLSELTDRAARILSTVDHLRDPRRATFEEKRTDITRLLADHKARADAIVQELTAGIR